MTKDKENKRVVLPQGARMSIPLPLGIFIILRLRFKNNVYVHAEGVTARYSWHALPL